MLASRRACADKVLKAFVRLRWRGGHPKDVMVELTALGFKGLRPTVAIGALAITGGIALAGHDLHDGFLYIVSAALAVDVLLAIALVISFNRQMLRALKPRSATRWQSAYAVLLWIFCAEVAAANFHFFSVRAQTGEYLSTLALFAIAVSTGGRMGFLPQVAGGALAIMFTTLAVAFYSSGLPRSSVMSAFVLLSAFVAAKAELQKSSLVVDQLRLRRRFQELAETDPLTGVANRRHFRAKLEAACERRNDLVVLLIDLDRFKFVNDTFGHNAGDQVLVRVAERLRTICRSDDVVARLGGDEFAILQLNPSSRAPPAAVADRILSAMADPFWIDSNLVQIGASVGFCFGDQGCHDPDVIVQHADTAMYDVKNRQASVDASALAVSPEHDGPHLDSGRTR